MPFMLSEKESGVLRDMLFHVDAAERFAHGQTFESPAKSDSSGADADCETAGLKLFGARPRDFMDGTWTPRRAKFPYLRAGTEWKQ
jgi:hypothetical protein